MDWESCVYVGSLHLNADRQAVELCETIKSQISSALAMIALACKMRLVATPDSSRLVLQSLMPSSSAGPSFGENFPETFTMGVGPESSGQRPSVDTMDLQLQVSHTDHLLQMFSTSLLLSPYKEPNQSKLAPVAETESQHKSHPSKAFRRQDSSPALLTFSHRQGSIMPAAILKRRATVSAFYSVKESGTDNSVDPLSQNSLTTSGSDSSLNSTDTPKVAGTLAHEVANTSSTKGNIDSVDASSDGSNGFGILSRTRRFGAWLGKVTHGEKMEVSRKDLNVFAPTSF